jgi:DNA-binding transcriptional MerR regulator
MNNEELTKVFSLDELCSLTDTAKRTVRFYIQSGLVDRPIGQRRGAHYTERHLEQLLFIAKWQKSGLSLERIRELLQQQAEPEELLPRRKAGKVEVWSHLTVVNGVEIHIEPGQAGLNSDQVRDLFKRVMALYTEIKNNED